MDLLVGGSERGGRRIRIDVSRVVELAQTVSTFRTFTVSEPLGAS